jgi:hypothetical protein
MPDILKSRKFWAAVVALALALFGPRAGVDSTQLTNAIYALIAYIIGTGLSDIRTGN